MNEESTNHESWGKFFVSLAEVECAQKKYLYRPWFPIGKLTLFGGDPGTGKTKLGLYVAAKVSRGENIEGVKCEAPGTVLIFSTEDDAGDIKATIAACGGDTSRVIVLSEDDNTLKALSHKSITFSSPIIEQAVIAFKPTLVIFDPLQKYIGRDIDTNQGNKTTASLNPIIMLAKRYEFALIVIQHFNKGDHSLQQKFAGSASIVGDSRSAIGIVEDPENQSEILAIHVKSNNRKGQTIRYKIESIPGNEDYAQVTIVDLEDYSAKDYYEAEKRRVKEKQDSAISDDDLTVATILRLLEDNSQGLKVGRYDIQTAASVYFDDYISLSLSAIIKKYASYLLTKHNIIITEKLPQNLKSFIINGRNYVPSKPKDRCLHIYKRGTPVQARL